MDGKRLKWKNIIFPSCHVFFLFKNYQILEFIKNTNSKIPIIHAGWTYRHYNYLAFYPFPGVTDREPHRF